MPLYFAMTPPGGVQVPYPLGGFLSSAARGSGQMGGNSTQGEDRRSVVDVALVNAPINSDVRTRHITPITDAVDGLQHLMPTYRSHRVQTAIYTQPGQASSPPWQADQYPMEHRPLIGRQPLGYGQALLYYEMRMARPPVNMIDYYIGQVTSDQAMSR